MSKFYTIRLLACLFFSYTCYGQTPVNSVSTVSNIAVQGGNYSQTITSHPSAVNGIQASTNYAVSYNNTSNTNINSFTISGKTYVQYDYFDTVILRRVANAWETTGGNKQQIYCEGNALIDNLFHTMPFPAAYPQVSNYAYMERVMKEGYINRGSDNVFNNDPNSDQTFNNIERVDFVCNQGVASTYTLMAGFLIAERGGNDPFKIAAITGIDANSNPTSFGPVLSVGTGSYGNSIVTLTTYVLRKDPADNALRPFSLVSLQGIKSVYISFNDLGIGPMQKIYGYALMAADVTATTSAELLNYTNNTLYPRNTTTTAGGMDLASAPGIYHTNLVLAKHNFSFSGLGKNCVPVLQWTDKDVIETKEYQLERSYDGENFEKIATVKPDANTNYSFTDANCQQAVAYYRVKVLSLATDLYYSSVVSVTKPCSGQKVSLYPNPVKEQLTVSLSSPASQITIYSANGKEYGKWSLNETDREVKLNLEQLPSGQYFIKLKEANGGQQSYPVLKL